MSLSTQPEKEKKRMFTFKTRSALLFKLIKNVSNPHVGCKTRHVGHQTRHAKGQTQHAKGLCRIVIQHADPFKQQTKSVKKHQEQNNIRVRIS